MGFEPLTHEQDCNKKPKKSTDMKLLISVFVIESPPLQTTLVGMGSAAVTTLLAPEIKVCLKTSYFNIRD